MPGSSRTVVPAALWEEGCRTVTTSLSCKLYTLIYPTLLISAPRPNRLLIQLRTARSSNMDSRYYGMWTRCKATTTKQATVQQLLLSNNSASKHISTATREHTIASCSQSRVEVGSNTSTVALQVVGGDEKGTQCLGV
jgi:hypothetical protein